MTPEQRERQRDYQKRWYQDNLEREREKGRQRYRQNAEVRRAKSREHYAENKDWYDAYQREYYRRHRDEWRARYEERRDELIERDRQRRKENAEIYRQRSKEYQARNRQKIAQRTRIARFRSNHGLWPEDLLMMHEAQDGLCYLCGEPLEERPAIDHDHSCCRKEFSCQICRRGLAHPNCNTAIGLAGDDPDRLITMAFALMAAKAAVEQRKADAGEQQALFG